MKVLICDDNKDFVSMVYEYLKEQEDMEIVGIAYDGNETLQKIDEFSPDVVLLDVIMPELDGVGVMQKLAEINLGMREQGIVCLVVNSSVKENDKATGEVIPAQFEVNLPTEELQRLLEQSFAGWKLMKTMMKKQQYDIPREGGISDLKTTVVTFVARKVDMKQ